MLVQNFTDKDVAVLEAILPVDNLRVVYTEWSPFLPFFMSWLISSLKP